MVNLLQEAIKVPVSYLAAFFVPRMLPSSVWPKMALNIPGSGKEGGKKRSHFFPLGHGSVFAHIAASYISMTRT